MDDRERVILSNLPLVIEPTVDVIEVAAKSSAEASVKERWSPLHRVPTVDVHQSGAPVPITLAHFFGPSPQLADNFYLICYQADGLLKQILRRNEQGGWDDHELQAELCGEVLRYPSVRLTFADERAKNAFLRYLHQVSEQKVYNPTLAMLLEKLVERPRELTVCKDKRDAE